MRLRINISGVVQGVGFRPFIYRLAQELLLNGYVLNDASGVLIEAEGEEEILNTLLVRIEKEKPVNSKILGLQFSFLEDAGFEEFEIRQSSENGPKGASVLPDISVCGDCLEEVKDPKDRRFLYLFTNCTNCGPRYTIINSLPYDRKKTSMKDFSMCPDCSVEYTSPTDRRFHAQPNACHVCGPWLSLYDNYGKLICQREDAFERAVNLIRRGHIVAVKGIGGYHLICDALNNESVQRLREKKNREERPLAVMFPDIESVKSETDINLLEERAINSVEKPIVIVKKREGTSIAEAVSPENGTVGAFLPYTPLHYIILKKLRKPVVATSGNMTDEPIARDDKDAFERLSNIAEYTLSHNREIVRRCDDSVIRVISGKQVPIRRSRGFVPVPVILPFRLSKPVLALGPQMNNTITLGIDNKAFISQHIGDLDNPLAVEFFEDTVRDFLKFFDVKPKVVVSDMHPGYYSTRFGEKHYGDRLIKVQHHFAHTLSCMADNDIPGNTEAIGFAFDGTGYGTDGTIWGSEVLIVSEEGYRRVCHLRPFRLPGGDKSVKEPCRTAFSILFDTFGDEAAKLDFSHLTEKEKAFFMNMIRNNINSPLTTGMGRLFDGISSMIGLKHKVSYHAQAAVLLEQTALRSGETGSYPFRIDEGVIDYREMIRKITDDLQDDMPREIIARKFHNTVTDIIINISESIKKDTGIVRVALSGGVFQNSILLENVNLKLKERGFIPLMHQNVPSNDGGISLGQIVAAGLQ
jgi:hydrogenase maturation protein HypF